ncbi:MAG TPA: PhzF family phenazine biosynthesis protein [Nevskiaceae bacterium]|nr:PhzF family phenazine biosynthesis protein [Nevskiaceae bacterium]
MKTVPIYQIDVFAEKLFGGNPAGVCPLDAWLPDATMQAIAAENNVAETAFFVKDESGAADFLLRWFTPTVEIELCGHATLASGYVLLEQRGFPRNVVRFRTLKAGVLSVERSNGALWLELPARMPVPMKLVPGEVPRGLRAEPRAVLESGNKYLALFDHAEDIVALKPDFAKLAQMNGKGVVVTAPGRKPGEDFVSRFFAPAMGVDEDPATGSAHCLLVPYWAQRLGKTELEAQQLSARGAHFSCRLAGERVAMSGGVFPYLKGEIAVP